MAPLAARTNTPLSLGRTKSEGAMTVHVHPDGASDRAAAPTPSPGAKEKAHKLYRVEQELVENRALLHRVLREKQQLLARCASQQRTIESLMTASSVFSAEIELLEKQHLFAHEAAADILLLEQERKLEELELKNRFKEAAFQHQLLTTRMREQELQSLRLCKSDENVAPRSQAEGQFSAAGRKPSRPTSPAASSYARRSPSPRPSPARNPVRKSVSASGPLCYAPAAAPLVDASRPRGSLRNDLRALHAMERCAAVRQVERERDQTGALGRVAQVAQALVQEDMPFLSAALSPTASLYTTQSQVKRKPRLSGDRARRHPLTELTGSPVIYACAANGAASSQAESVEAKKQLLPHGYILHSQANKTDSLGPHLECCNALHSQTGPDCSAIDQSGQRPKLLPETLVMHAWLERAKEELREREACMRDRR
ncbi:hypothetical protein AB1Y20_002629 [Prymnesium parvum]|uniref:Uncharacterized protein n=1 Tax=Prymnesium parvum TaxID=97485 RepID=A0AB34JBK9_PRYPA